MSNPNIDSIIEAWDKLFPNIRRGTINDGVIESTAYLREVLESQQKEFKKMLEEIPCEERILHPASAAAPGCNKCGFNNDHSECQCKYNQHVQETQEAINKITKRL